MAGRGIGQLFARKSVEQMHAEHQAGELKKSLGAVNLVLLGIGCIIGTGIFVLTGRAAAEFAGPGIMISFVITGMLCALVALCYSELAAAIPVSGSAYSYSYASLGEFVAWIMGVLLLLEYGVAASTVAVGWSGYTVSLLNDLGIHLPHALTQAPAPSLRRQTSISSQPIRRSLFWRDCDSDRWQARGVRRSATPSWPETSRSRSPTTRPLPIACSTLAATRPPLLMRQR